MGDTEELTDVVERVAAEEPSGESLVHGGEKQHDERAFRVVNRYGSG